MTVATRRCLAVLVTALLVLPPAAALARGARGGPLTGTWSGYIRGSYGSRQRIVLVVNARETRGSWRLGRRCYGTLTLDSISGGYHHFLRHHARGTTCAGGDIDCLKRAGRNLYDAVTSHRGGAWDSSGTLSRTRPRRR